MYPTISDFLREAFGWNIPLPIQTYGFFYALGFIAGIYITNLEFKRKEREGFFNIIRKRTLVGAPATPQSLIISAIGAFFVGFKLIEAIFHYSEFVANPQIFILSSRGSMLGGIVAAIASAGFTYWEKDKERKKYKQPKWEDVSLHPYEITGNLLIVMAVTGILGAKIFHNLENFDEFLKDPIDAIFSFSGLTFFGGLICGGAGVIWYTRRNGLNPYHVFDVGAVGVPMAYAVGRLGCHISGDGCWGIPNTSPKPDWMSFLPDWTWSYRFPHNVVNEGIPIDNCVGSHCRILDVPVFPTSLYEAVFMFIIFGILWSIRKKIKIPGLLFSIYLMFAGVERFLMELIRVNTKYHTFGISFTQAELISILLFTAGVVSMILVIKYKDKIQAKKLVVEKGK